MMRRSRAGKEGGLSKTQAHTNKKWEGRGESALGSFLVSWTLKVEQKGVKSKELLFSPSFSLSMDDGGSGPRMVDIEDSSSLPSLLRSILLQWWSFLQGGGTDEKEKDDVRLKSKAPF